MKRFLLFLHVLLLWPFFFLFVTAQEIQEFHPWLTDCDEYDCFLGYYCNYDNQICEACPDSASGDDDICKDITNSSSTSNDNNINSTMTTESCHKWCVRSQQGQTCSTNNPCQEGKTFCDLGKDGQGGTCRACPLNVSDCLTMSLTSDFAVEECLLCDLKCVPLHFSETTIIGSNNGNEAAVVLSSNALLGSPSLTASGPLVDCSNVIYKDQTRCHDDVVNKVCLVHESTRNAYYVDVVNKCADSGGIAVIMFGDFTPETDNSVTWTGSLSFKETTIPSVSISYNDGIFLQKNISQGLPITAQVSVSSVGEYCEKRQFCSDTIPCIGTNEGKYCDYKWTPNVEGFCRDCPVDGNDNPAPLGCFFNISGDDLGKVTGQPAVESCANVCAGSLEFSNCKLCPENINGFNFGMESESERCNFCPENDLQYPRQEFPLFGEGIECWQVQKFYESVEIGSGAPNCRLAQMMNYVCGCAGPGYGGASTETKRVVLAWLPRVMAVLSLLGSCFVIFDASRKSEKRQKLLYQLLISLSTFDIIGSCAYALTTVPIPTDDLIPVYGAEGNDATCIAQGFFIQMGTISCFTNVSLSIYYLLAIKFGQSERQLKQKRLWLILCPILVGLAFAFAGIPFYGNMILWCNNTASWWPEIPVLTAILIATIVMTSVCWDVYWKEKASAKWRTGGARNTLSKQVFWQSFCYLMAFYLTWPAYLALQYSWASDNYFTNYGLILSAGMMVPLQGFWNAFVYTRPRQLKRMGNSARRVSSMFIGRLRTTQTASDWSLIQRSFRLARFQTSSVAQSFRNTDTSSRNSSRPSGEHPSLEDGSKDETTVSTGEATSEGVRGIDEENALSRPCKSHSNEEVAVARLQNAKAVSFRIDSKERPSTVVDVDQSLKGGER